MKYRIAKGVFDILPKDPEPAGKWRESSLWQHLESCIREICAEFGYLEIRTPLFETTELFSRSIGSDTDIVSKEMYTFEDKAKRSLTLRPEGTAPVMRAFIEKNLDQQSPLHKFFYLMPMFRYERQQAGRYRQHHQFGVEAIGNTSPFQDAEIIHLLWTLYIRLGLKDLTLHLNSIGDLEARKAYRHELKMYLRPHFEQLSDESKERYEVNPLRILDSKNPADQKLLHDAPHILDSLSQASKEHFEKVCSLLQELKIPYLINHRLVRGLDYYNNLVFEITSSELGSQNSLGGGGRYDGLIQKLGGADLPACGFGAGLERIIQTMLAQNAQPPPSAQVDLFLIPLGDAASLYCFNLMSTLREAHLKVEMDLTGKKLKNVMRHANSLGAAYVAVIGENELNQNKIELKEMETGSLQSITIQHSFEGLIDALQKNT